jgi:sigma-B regulation protein RsbU (phosphoserine phosphatase)
MPESVEAIFTENSEGIITSWNKQAEVLLGYPACDVLGHSSAMLAPSNMARDEEDIRSRVLQGLCVRRDEVLRVCKDGCTIIASVLFTPLFNETGEAIGMQQIFGVSAEWTQESEKMQLLAAIVRDSGNSIISMDINGFITSWNLGAEQIFGFTAAEAIGKHVTFFVPAELQQAELDIIEGIRQGRPRIRHETSRLCKDGTRAHGLVSVSPIYDKSGKIIGASRIGFDITERKRAEERMSLLVAALEAVGNGVVVTNVTGQIEWVNDAFTRLTGFTLAEVQGQYLSIQKSGKVAPEVYAHMWKTILKGEIWRGEMVNRRKDGSTYHEEMVITPIRNSHGGLTHFIAVKQDITERIQSAHERECLIRELQDALASVQTLSGLLPICASCKKVRDDSGYWSQVEVYIQKHSGARFTHGICPDCAARMIEELDKEVQV